MVTWSNYTNFGVTLKLCFYALQIPTKSRVFPSSRNYDVIITLPTQQIFDWVFNQKLLHFGHHFLTCPTFVPHSTFCVTALSILVHKKYINSWMCVWMSWYWYDMYDNPYDSYNRYIVILSHSSAPSYHNRSLCPYIMDRLHGKFLMGIQHWCHKVCYQ